MGPTSKLKLLLCFVQINSLFKRYCSGRFVYPSCCPARRCRTFLSSLLLSLMAQSAVITRTCARTLASLLASLLVASSLLVALSVMHCALIIRTRTPYVRVCRARPQRRMKKETLPSMPGGFLRYFCRQMTLDH